MAQPASSGLLQRSHTDPTTTTMFEMDNEQELTSPLPNAQPLQRRGSVEDEIAAANAEEVASDTDDLEERTLPIPITRADSPTDEEDIESALLNATSKSAGPSSSSGSKGGASKGLSVGDFELLSVVGRGAYGKVFLVRRLTTGRHYAMKVVRKSEAIRKNVVDNMRAEREVLEAVRHPFIVNLRYAFQSASKLYLVMDFVSGGELFTRLNDSRDHALPVKDCRFYAATLVLALEHLHSLNIVYRDLKPENILLQKCGYICLTDMGFAKENISAAGEGSGSFCGTLQYMSPEMINRTGHGQGSDWWALGSVLCEMLTGSCPFSGSNRKALQENILSAPLKLPKYLDAPTKSIITELLRRPIAKRLGCGPDGAAAIKRHPFFTGINWTALSKKQVTPPFVPQLAHDQDTKHFDIKFTAERAIDTPCSPSQMAAILKDHGISPQTFQSADAVFASFSYMRDHTPGPSPALRAMEMPTRARTASIGPSATAARGEMGSPRPLSGLPPLHSHGPELLELPGGGGGGGGGRSMNAAAAASAAATAAASSPSAAYSSDPDAWPEVDPQTLTVLAQTRAANASLKKATAAAGFSAAPVAAASSTLLTAPQRVKKPTPVKAASPPPTDHPAAAAPATGAPAAMSQLSQQIAQQKRKASQQQSQAHPQQPPHQPSAPSTPSDAKSSVPAPAAGGIRVLGAIQQLAISGPTTTAPPASAAPSLAGALAATHAPPKSSSLRPPGKGLSAAAPVFVPGGFDGPPPSAARASVVFQPTAQAPPTQPAVASPAAVLHREASPPAEPIAVPEARQKREGVAHQKPLVPAAVHLAQPSHTPASMAVAAPPRPQGSTSEQPQPLAGVLPPALPSASQALPTAQHIPMKPSGSLGPARWGIKVAAPSSFTTAAATPTAAVPPTAVTPAPIASPKPMSSSLAAAAVATAAGVSARAPSAAAVAPIAASSDFPALGGGGPSTTVGAKSAWGAKAK